MPGLNGVDVNRVDPLELDLDTADALAAVVTAANDAAGLALPPRAGAAFLYRQLTSENRPVDGLWVARAGGRVVGHVDLELPRDENTDTAHIRGHVHPEARRQGIGRALLDEAVGAAREAGRSRVYSGAFENSEGTKALEAAGFTRTDGRYAVRRVDLHATPLETWDELYDEAASHASDYELTRLAGATPDTMLAGMATLHEAINDAPSDDGEERSRFDEQRVRDYDTAMAGRRQTVYRVLARHRSTGEWAGLSMLCVDEFAPTVAFQEDTSVVRAHRGHRLGLLMKAEMLRWVAAGRPEVSATDTWNSVSNHHMIAVNERLGARVVAVHQGYRLDL